MTLIHPTAFIHKQVQLSPDVEIGAFTQIEENASLQETVHIGCFAHIFSGVTLGKGAKVFDGAIVGNAPQDLKYQGEATLTFIGEGTQIREYATINRGTQATGFTRIGDNCLIMAYTHIAHDCDIGHRVVLANAIQMGGHVRIGSDTVISGLTGIHQFVTVGAGCFIGGGLRVDKDILPYTKALGEPLQYAGINEIGLRKQGFGSTEALLLKKLYRQLFVVGKKKFLEQITETQNDGTWKQLPKTLQQELQKFLESQKRVVLMRGMIKEN